jgi:Lon protease-like protein
MKLPLFPLHTVLFPGMLLPLHIFEPRYRKMINECLDGNRPFGVALIAQGPEVGGRAEPHAVGTWALISRVERQPDGRMSIEAVGQERFRILRLHDDEDYLTGTVERFPLGGAKEDRAQQLARRLRPWLERYLTLLGQAVDSPFDAARLPHDPLPLAYLAAIVAQIPLGEKQALLETPTAAQMLERERVIYRRELSLLRAMLGSPQAKDAAAFSAN